jgi:hypothetical protein
MTSGIACTRANRPSRADGFNGAVAKRIANDCDFRFWHFRTWSDVRFESAGGSKADMASFA